MRVQGSGTPHPNVAKSTTLKWATIWNGEWQPRPILVCEELLGQPELQAPLLRFWNL